MRSILGFVDRIGSNSSDVSRTVANELDWAYVSFGEYINKEIEVRGWPSTREKKQEVGKLLIAQGWEKFCQAVLKNSSWQPGKPLVVDGIRHVAALRTIQRITETDFVRVVYVKADDEMRKARLVGREVKNEMEFERAEADSTEQEVKTVLPEMADLIVDATEPTEQLVPKIVELVKPSVDDPPSEDDQTHVHDPLAENEQTHAVAWLKQAESLAPARQRGESKKQQLLGAEGGTVDVHQAAGLLNLTTEVIDEWRKQGKLIAIYRGNTEYVYPRWQFVAGEVLPGLEDVLGELRNYDSWTQLAFMLNPNVYLHGEIPLNQLQHGRVLEVQRAARAYGEQGGA